jgi:outer membrane receptor protein involved in Fe transport
MSAGPKAWGLATLAVAGPALAQGPLPTGLEEIVVTATKRETRLQETPVTMTAITGDFLDSVDARDFSAYVSRVPGLTAIDQGPGRKRYILRGVSNQDSNLSQATVSQYVDEVPITNSFGNQPDPRLTDVERVEVLRGPQGTLFGARAMAGSVRTFTRKPVMDRFEGNAQVTGSYTKFGGFNANVEAVANLPLVEERLAFRATAFYSHDEGYVDNVFPGGTFVAQPGQLPPGIPNPRPVTLPPQMEENFSDVTTYGGRGTLRWQASDALRVTVMGLAQIGKVDGVPNYSVQLTGNEADGLITSISGNVGNDDKLFIGSFTAEYALDFADVTALASYAKRDNFVLGASNVAGPLLGAGAGSTRTFGNDIRGWTVESRIASRSEGPWRWLAGVYGFWQDNDGGMREFIGFGQTTTVDLTSDEDSREYAAFGELTYKIIEPFALTAGARYSESRNQLSRFYIVPPPSERPGLDPDRPLFKEEAVTLKFEASYKASPDVFIYALAAEGFRPGGFNGNAQPGLNTIPAEFTSDSLWSYELGAKTTWLDGRLIANGALYHIDWNDIQVLSFIPNPFGPGTQPFTTNASSAVIQGFELELSARLNRSLSVNGSLNHFFKAELEADAPISPTGSVARAGDQLPYNSKWSFQLGGEYRLPVSPALEGSLRVDWTYAGQRFTSFRPQLASGQVNTAYNDLPGYHTVDVRLGVSADLWRATLFVENIFDARPIINQQNFTPVPVSLRITRKPRTVGLTVRRQF